jgi:heme exporter protein C
MVTQFANPARFEGFARIASPIAFWVMTLALAAGAVWGLFIAPMDSEMGDGYRLIFVHVPAAYLAMLVYVGIVAAALVGFVWRHPLADIAARVAAPIGAVFCVLALLTGMVWGKPMWGAYWVWNDARLVSVLVLFLFYLALIAIWAAADNPQRGARLAGIAALIGAVNIPIIKFSVDWWATLHQPATVIALGDDGGLETNIALSMLWPLLLMCVGYTAAYVWLLLMRMRSAIELRKAEGLERRALGAQPSRARLEDAAPGAGPVEGALHG